MPHTDNPTPRTGKIMLFVAWIIGMVLLTQVFDQIEEKRINPNKDPHIALSGDGSQQLILQRNRYGHYLFNGQINGVNAVFLVDTGATTVAIPASLAKKMSLPVLGQHHAQTANGATLAYLTKLDTLKLGPFLVRNINASILPSMDGNQEVLLGMSALKYLAFSQKKNTLILEALN